MRKGEKKKKKNRLRYCPFLLGRSLLLLKENSLLGPSGDHSSQHVQPQAAETDRILLIDAAKDKSTKFLSHSNLPKMTGCNSPNRVNSKLKWSFMKLRWFLHIMNQLLTVKTHFSMLQGRICAWVRIYKVCQISSRTTVKNGYYSVWWTNIVPPSLNMAIHQKRVAHMLQGAIVQQTFRSRSIASILSASDCGSNSSPISLVSMRGSFWKGKRPVNPWIFWEPLDICWWYISSWNRKAGLGFRRTLMALPAKRTDSATRIWIYSGSISCKVTWKD